MTKLKHSLAAALGFLAIGLAAAPVSADSLSAAKPAFRSDQNADVQLTGGGSWHDKGHYYGRKHYRGDRFGSYDDHYFRGGKKKYKRAYRSGYEDGYYEGRRDGKFSRRGFSRYDDFGRRYRGRHHDHHGGSGYVRTPGFYFRF